MFVDADVEDVIWVKPKVLMLAVCYTSPVLKPWTGEETLQLQTGQVKFD